MSPMMRNVLLAVAALMIVVGAIMRFKKYDATKVSEDKIKSKHKTGMIMIIVGVIIAAVAAFMMYRARGSSAAFVGEQEYF
jgi:hypothetical protein